LSPLSQGKLQLSAQLDACSFDFRGKTVTTPISVETKALGRPHRAASLIAKRDWAKQTARLCENPADAICHSCLFSRRKRFRPAANRHFCCFGERLAPLFPAAQSAVTIERRNAMLILLIILFVLVFAAAPAWPYSRGWGYYPSGGLGLVLVVLLVLLLAGYVRI
jgi:hypothetical protein